MSKLRNELDAAAQTAELLTSSIRAAHSAAAYTDGAVGQLAADALMELIGYAAGLQRKLERLQNVVSL